MNTSTTGPVRLCANIICKTPIPAVRRSNAKYCSPECASIASSRDYVARRQGLSAWKRPVPEPCARDGCDRVVDTERLRRQAKYCSPECLRRTRATPNRERPCARSDCARTVPIERARHGGRYCSDRCARAARGERSAAHAKRSRALIRQRAAARRDRALASTLETLSQEATDRIRELEAGEAAIARQLADLEEIAVGHEQNAQQLARWLWHLAAVYGDRLVMDERVQTLLRHYLPELAGPTGDHQHADDAGAPSATPRAEGW